MIGQSIQQVIKDKVIQICSKKQVPELSKDMIQTDNIGQVIQKLVILHIRMWMLQDQLGVAKSDQQIASLKKKTDICFKIKRPRYVQAINKMIEECIKNNKSLIQDSVKIYNMM